MAYKGKFTYATNAKDENIYVSLPAGLRPNAPAQLFSTWTKSYHGYEKAPLVSTGHLAFEEGDNERFVFYDGYYTWKGRVLSGGDKLELEIWYGDEKTARAETVVELIPLRE